MVGVHSRWGAEAHGIATMEAGRESLHSHALSCCSWRPPYAADEPATAGLHQRGTNVVAHTLAKLGSLASDVKRPKSKETMPSEVITLYLLGHSWKGL
jgi:hypothetical protein